MRRTEVLQEIRTMQFVELYGNWQERRLTQEEAARLLGVHERTFRRYINRYEEEGLSGLADKRLQQVSHRRAPVDEVLRVQALYRERYDGWNVKHFHSHYRRRHDGQYSYSWVKNTLHQAGLVSKAPARGKHRKRREPSAMPGMMVHQDGSTHEWVPGCWWDLIVTMDDATNEHYSMFFVAQEGTASSFRGVYETLTRHGLFCSLYTDRGSHYWHTPVAGGKVDKQNPTQFGRAMAQLGIEMIPAYSPQARGRSERMFATHQDRLVKELAAAGITSMDAANDYLEAVYRPAYNEELTRPARESGSAFVPLLDIPLTDILCEQFERTVGQDNCVSFEAMVLQIPQDQHRMHYVKTKVRVHRYHDGSLAVFHGPRKLAEYDSAGKEKNSKTQVAA
jgi:transposase